MGARHPACIEWEFVFVPNGNQAPLLGALTAVPVEYLDQQYPCFDLCNNPGCYMGGAAG